MAEPFFNYIITIHNKEDLIHDVLVSVLLCCGSNSRIYAVLDGCTDGTEKILDAFTDQFDGVPLTKVHAADVHELLSINIGLRAAVQEGYGFNIILQDDVILADVNLERKIRKLYEWGSGKLGYVSLRLGANFEQDALTTSNAIPLTDYIENAYGHALPDAETLLPARFAYRTVPIKSPVCLPADLVMKVGLMNEALAPYAHDDTDLAIRITSAGYFNGVFAMRFYSEVKWGGTRVTPHPHIHKIQLRNMGIIRERLGPELERILATPQAKGVIEFPEMMNAGSDAHAIQYYEQAKQMAKLSTSTRAKISGGLRRVFSSIPRKSK